MHKALATLLAVISSAAHARYEEEAFGGEGARALDEANLLAYIAAGLALWLYLVWERGWRARAVPLALAGVGVIASAVWGSDGLGMLVIASCVVALLYGALRRN